MIARYLGTIDIIKILKIFNLFLETKNAIKLREIYFIHFNIESNLFKLLCIEMISEYNIMFLFVIGIIVLLLILDLNLKSV